MNRSESHPPRQERSRLTEQALIDAALRLFQARGMDAVTTADIALAAGVAPATINRRFGDRAGLERHAFRVFIDRALLLVGSVDAGAGAPSLVALLARIAAAVLGFAHANQRLLRSAHARALLDADYADGLRELRRSVLALLRAELAAHGDEIGHPRPALAIDFALQQAMAMLSARTEAAHLDTGGLDDATFNRELMRSLLAYLQVECSDRQIDRALRLHGLQPGQGATRRRGEGRA